MEAKELAKLAIQALEDKKAEDVKVIDISDGGLAFCVHGDVWDAGREYAADFGQSKRAGCDGLQCGNYFVDGTLRTDGAGAAFVYRLTALEPLLTNSYNFHSIFRLGMLKYSCL